jgi:hypothetical protein
MGREIQSRQNFDLPGVTLLFPPNKLDRDLPTLGNTTPLSDIISLK